MEICFNLGVAICLVVGHLEPSDLGNASMKRSARIQKQIDCSVCWSMDTEGFTAPWTDLI